MRFLLKVEFLSELLKSQFLGLSGSSWSIRTFLQKWGFATSYLMTTWLQGKNKKKWWANSAILRCERRDERTEGRTDKKKQSQIHKALPPVQLSKSQDSPFRIYVNWSCFNNMQFLLDIVFFFFRHISDLCRKSEFREFISTNNSLKS